MNLLTNITSIYFIGIGGIGMSALARFADLKGYAVFGYDKTETSLTKKLMAEGIDITFEDSIKNLPNTVKDKDKTLVVYTPAVPKMSVLLNWFKDHDYTVVKRAKFLGEVTKDTMCLAVAGTHGKTTTSAILGHLLASSDMPVTAFLGGISENYSSNFISRGTEITVVEADEFDRSFLTLSPDVACITSMDADHLDIYGDVSEIEKSFRDFAGLIKEKDHLLFKKGLRLEGQDVAIEEEAAFEAQRVRIENGVYVFDLKTPQQTIKDLTFVLPGHHNLQNAIMALGMAILAGSPIERLPKAIATFEGVERRFSYRIRTDHLVLIDDYAHHPTEIDALFQAVSEMYPNERNVIVFQPHLFSRTRDFADGFARSLSQFDEVFLLDIYPAREEPIEGISSELLKNKIMAVSKDTPVSVIGKAKISEVLKISESKIKLIVGAGDIGAEVATVTKKIKDEN